MRKKEMLAVVEALTTQPTAPFHEDAVRDEIEAQLRKMPHVKFMRDGFGNVIAHYQRGRKRAADWGLAAHMDHPGWVRDEDGEMKFLGSVAAHFRSNPKKKSFGDFEMWDLLPFEVRDGQIHSRACDDLIGCAEIICVFRELEERGANAHCVGLFTRAEEVGFVGAIKLAKAEILPRSLTILSLETSTPRGNAVIGQGPIVRVGDKASSFDGPSTARLLAAAAEEKIPVQRCLLDGGTCEATAYQLYGYTCAAASLALGNYHNVTPEGKIAAEFVSIDDFVGMVRLCRALVLRRGKGSDPQKALRQKLEGNAREYSEFY
ncbi:MAG: M20/M25/M40 family metallo-hydrolase [Spartobacteria bacterium]